MLARYYSLVQRLPAPSVLVTAAGQWSANAAAAFALTSRQSEDALRAACRATIADGVLRSERIADAQFYVAPLFDDHGGCDAAVGIAAPFGELPRLLHLFQQPLRTFGRIVHELPVPVGVARPNGRFDFFNDRWFAVFGIDRRRRPEEVFLAALDERDRTKAAVAWQSGIASGSTFSFRARFATSAGARWQHLDARPMVEAGRPIKWICTLTDVDDEVLAHDALSRSERELRRIAQVSAGLSRAVRTEHVGSAVAAAGRDEGEVWSLLTAPGRFADAEHADGSAERFVRIPGHDARIAIRGRGPLDALRERTSSIAAEIAVRVGLVLDRLAAADRERQLAERLQHAMLPAVLPCVDGVRCDVTYSPADAEMFVGGDWYDAFVLPDGRLAFTIGDVAGHGTDAAVAMGAIRQQLRARAYEESNPEHVLGHLNRALCLEGIVASAVFGTLDPLTGEVIVANAGHPPPYLVEPSGKLTAIRGDGVLLGVCAGRPAPARSLIVPPGAAFVLYTDGLIETTRDLDAAEARLQAVLAEWARNGFARDADGLRSVLLGGDVGDDDVAMVVLHVEARPHLDATLPATARNAVRLRRAVQRIATSVEPDADRAFDMTLAVAEAINNVSEHAYRGDVGPIKVVVDRRSDVLEARVIDSGAWQPPTAAPDRGRGLGLIRTLVPDAEIRTDEHGTVVSLRCALGSRAAASAASE